MVRHTNTWMFNIKPENWEQFVNGPNDATIHGEQNIGKPAQGVRAAAPTSVDDIEEGDLGLARRKGDGIAGIWEVRDVVPLGDQKERNYWDGEEYSAIIYCDALDREFNPHHEEDFDAFADDFGVSVNEVTGNIQGAARNLRTEYKSWYLSRLLEHDPINEEAQSRLSNEHESIPLKSLENATFWMTRAGVDGELWEVWNQHSPPVITVGWDIGPPEEVDFHDETELADAVDERYGLQSTDPVEQLRQFFTGESPCMEPGDYVVILGDASVEAVARVGRFTYEGNGLPADPSHTYWREIDYLCKSREKRAVPLDNLSPRFGLKPDGSHGSYSLYDLYRAIDEYDIPANAFVMLVSELAAYSGMDLSNAGEVFLNEHAIIPGFTARQRAVLEQWNEVAQNYVAGAEFDFANHDRTHGIQEAADAFIAKPTEERFKQMWNRMHSAVQRGTAAERLKQWDSSLDDLATLIQEMRDAEGFDSTWRNRLGGKTTVWELFGSLHIGEYPIINAATIDGLAFFGYENPDTYKEGLETFLDFRDIYAQVVGHATQDASHGVEVPINLEIDQLFNVIDKVDESSIEEESADAAINLYRTILEKYGGLEGKPQLVRRAQELVADVGEETPELYRQAVAHLVAGRNIVFYGPPGTGKTRAARLIADGLCTDYRIETGNAEWSNYHVVGGWQPTDDGNFAAARGFLTEVAEACRTELADTGGFEWLIVDELNRANLDQAFGDVFTMLDIDYRVDDTVTYATKDQAIPLSFRLLATMNSYDRAQLFALGYAFRRRFAFVPVASLFSSQTQPAYDEWGSASGSPPGMAVDNAGRVREIAREETVAHFNRTGGSHRGKVSLPPDDAGALDPGFAQVDIETEIDTLLDETSLQIHGLDPIGAILHLIGTAHDAEVIEVGQAAIIDVFKYLTAYHLLFPDAIGPHVVDQAVTSYLVPQFDAFMPDLRRAQTIDENEEIVNRYRQVVDTASQLGLERSSQRLMAPLDAEDFDLI